jgi:hypothetical protein
MKNSPLNRPGKGLPPLQRDPLRLALSLLPSLLIGALAACGGGGGGGSGSSTPKGTILDNPATGLKVVVDPHQGGDASKLRLTGVFWGRLVEVQDFDPLTSESVQQFTDFLIGEDITTNGVDFKLDRNPVTEREILTILHPFGTPEWDSAFAQLEANLQNVLDKGLGPTSLPPYTAVPRNAAMMLRFDDLLEDGGDPGDPGYPGSIIPENLHVEVGYPPSLPYELRILPDPNHGDVISGQFHTTRVILDMTVSKLEAQLFNLPINSLGLPEAITTSQPNVVLRIPTVANPAAAQFDLLKNLKGNGVSFNGNGSTLPTSPTLDVVRAFRSGGKTAITGDPNNGFLVDDILPQILGTQPTQITKVTVLGGKDFLVDYTFAVLPCSSTPRVGDVFDLPGFLAQVTSPGLPPVNGQVTGTQIELLFGDPVTFGPTVGQYKTAWDPLSGALPGCFVRFSQAPTTPPLTGVVPDATVTVAFSEPMDPSTVQAFDTLTLINDLPTPIPAPKTPLFLNVVGHVVASLDLKDFTFEPELPLNHVQGSAEKYFVDVVSGAAGVTDLAGNPLLNALPQVPFTIEPSAASFDSGGITIKFDDQDEDGNGFPELRGQFLIDPLRKLIKPRTPSRFSAVADASKPIVGSMISFGYPIQTPLSNLGSKMQTVWRYCDLGFSLLDEINHNIDVEHLYWSPFSSGVLIDNFPLFQMGLAHSAWLPDEQISTQLLPQFPFSGLTKDYGLWGGTVGSPGNLLDPLAVVHPKPLGYHVDPQNLTVATTGTQLMPWPLNQNMPISQFKHFTWRDTANTKVAAFKGAGADPQRLVTVTGTGIQGFFAIGKVPTIGLPLLMEFRTYPDDGAGGQNGFKIALALNSSALPAFRVFSTGGILASGVPKKIDPDNEPMATGGINPANGGPTAPWDNSFYYGQGDFLVRVSRAHTIWFDTLSAHSFITPVVEPLPSLQPLGTQVVLAFRGATSIIQVAPNGTKPWENASVINPYGETWNTQQVGPTPSSMPPGKGLGLGADKEYTVTFLPDATWKNQISQVNGARYIQARITFIANPETLLGAELSAVGFPFFK